MKKTSSLPGLLGLLGLLFTASAFLFPIGTGLILAMSDGSTEAFPGYDFVFANNASQISSNPSMIAFFVLIIVAADFQLLATAFGWFGGKFTAFLQIVAGLCLLACAVLIFLSPIIIGSWVTGDTVTLGYGFIVAGASAAASALVSLIVGIRGFSVKAI
jgi:hypothetical protein